MSMGVRGAHLTISDRGTRSTVGLPGSGASYTHYEPFNEAAHNRPPEIAETQAPQSVSFLFKPAGIVLMIGIVLATMVLYAIIYD